MWFFKNVVVVLLCVCFINRGCIVLCGIVYIEEVNCIFEVLIFIGVIYEWFDDEYDFILICLVEFNFDDMDIEVV